MDPSLVMPVLTMAMATAAVVGMAVAEDRRRRRTQRALELVHSGDWGLDRRRLWASPDQFWFTAVGGAPRMGRVRWTHEAIRSGRRFLVAEEVFAQGKSSRVFVVVAGRHAARGLTFFTNGGDVSGTLPGNVADALVSFVRRGGRAVIVFDGLLVLRCRRHRDAAAALDLAAWVVEQLELATLPALPPFSTQTWQQPPRRR